MSGHQLLQLGDQRRMSSQRELGLDAGLVRRQAQLLQASGLALDEGVVGQVGQHRPAPQL
jgi:hypothetical protein